MEQIKRQRTDSFDDNDTKRLLTARRNRTQFEDLSNELIYEIFDYLDFYNVYQSFYNLNSRFRSFLLESTLPLKINLFLMSKTTFNDYNEHIIIPNRQRISHLRISNYFMFDKQTFAFSYQTSLRTLVIENIRLTHVRNILHQLTSLSNLCSLSISIIGATKNINPIYEQIFRLSTLKYLKLSFRRSYPKVISSIIISNSSLIEHLIIDHGIDLNELTALLLYTPNLRYLSTNLWYKTDFILKYPCHILNHLTHISLMLCSGIPFDDLEKFFMNYCPFVQVLYVSAYDHYIDANRWKQLLSLSLPNLRIFNIRLEMYSNNNNIRETDIELQMNCFNSSFWTKRRWFFEYVNYLKMDAHKTIIYSTNPFRRKKYRIGGQVYKVTDINRFQTYYKSVDHIKIANEEAINQYMFDFPHVTQLTFEENVSIISSKSIITKISRILRLKQIKVLTIEYESLCPLIMCELLCSIPNLHTLTFHSMLFESNDKLSIEQNEVFRFVSQTNLIKNVIFKGFCSLYEIEMILKLFPRLQCLTLDLNLKDIQLILEFLLNKNNTNTHRLILVCFLHASRLYIHHLNNLIESEIFPYDLKTLYDDRSKIVYVWW